MRHRRYQAFLIRRQNELRLIEQGLYNNRIDSLYSLGDIVRVFKYTDAQKVVREYPELLSVDKNVVTVKSDMEALVVHPTEGGVFGKEYKPQPSGYSAEEKEMEIIRL